MSGCVMYGIRSKHKNSERSGNYPSWPEVQVPNIIIFSTNSVNTPAQTPPMCWVTVVTQGGAGTRPVAGTSLVGCRRDAQEPEISNEGQEIHNKEQEEGFSRRPSNNQLLVWNVL